MKKFDLSKISKSIVVFVVVMIFLLSSCNSEEKIVKVSDGFRNYYEIFVRSFNDTNKDGIGDINGVTSKLDYISQSVGADGIWLMPIMPSPSYHKYDITDYYSIDPKYGSIKDFESLIDQAHKRDVKVIIDLVLNHTSNLHPWFDNAVKALWEGKESKYSDYYNFTLEDKGQGYSKITDKYYYECRFVSNMPDLNLDNPMLREEILEITKFWIGKGVDGFRLDAVTSFYTGDNAKNIEFLSWLNKGIKAMKTDAYIVGEAWSDSGTIEEYYKSGIDSFFNFPYSQASGEIVSALNNRFGTDYANKLKLWNSSIEKINPTAKDAMFLSNHDNGRSAGFLMRNPVKEKMAAALYLLTPGNPFIYYGEELGMTGSGKDENKRLPMLWSLTDKSGITSPPPGSTQTIDGIKGADEQIKDNESLINYYRKILLIKERNPEIARGKITVIDVGQANREVCAFACTFNEKKVYVFHNLSEKDILISLDLLDWKNLEIRDFLVTNAEAKPLLKNGSITLPALSTTILR